MIQLMQNKSRFAFPFCWGQWNQETNQKMIECINFKNGVVKDCFNKTISERVWYIVVAVFLVTLVGL